MTCRPPPSGWQAQSRQAPPPPDAASAKGGALRPWVPCGVPRSLGVPRSSVQRQQILLVASDQFRIAVAATDLVVAHSSPIAGGGKLVQLVKALLVMRVRRRRHDRSLVGQLAGSDHRGVKGVARPRRRSRFGRSRAPGLPGALCIALSVVNPNVTSLEHAGAAGRVLHAPILGIEPRVDRCFGPRFGLVAYHHAGAIGPFVVPLGRAGRRHARSCGLIARGSSDLLSAGTGWRIARILVDREARVSAVATALSRTRRRAISVSTSPVVGTVFETISNRPSSRG